MAIQNAVVAVIPSPDDQKLFDRICLYVGVSCFLCVHIVGLIFVVIKVRSFSVMTVQMTIMFPMGSFGTLEPSNFCCKTRAQSFSLLEKKSPFRLLGALQF